MINLNYHAWVPNLGIHDIYSIKELFYYRRYLQSVFFM